MLPGEWLSLTPIFLQFHSLSRAVGRQAHRPYVHSPAGRVAPGPLCDLRVPISWLLVFNGFDTGFAHPAKDHLLGPLGAPFTHSALKRAKLCLASIDFGNHRSQPVHQFIRACRSRCAQLRLLCALRSRRCSRGLNGQVGRSDPAGSQQCFLPRESQANAAGRAVFHTRRAEPDRADASGTVEGSYPVDEAHTAVSLIRAREATRKSRRARCVRRDLLLIRGGLLQQVA